jgi:hypothetical protein
MKIIIEYRHRRPDMQFEENKIKYPAGFENAVGDTALTISISG